MKLSISSNAVKLLLSAGVTLPIVGELNANAVERGFGISHSAACDRETALTLASHLDNIATESTSNARRDALNGARACRRFARKA